MSAYLRRWMADRTPVRPGRTGQFLITDVRDCAGDTVRCENTERHGACDGVVDLAQSASGGVRFYGLHVYDDLQTVEPRHITNRFGDAREPFADLGWDPARQVTR